MTWPTYPAFGLLPEGFGPQVLGTAAATPEPSTVALLVAGIALLGLRKPGSKTAKRIR